MVTDNTFECNDINVIIRGYTDLPPDELLTVLDTIKSKNGRNVILLSSVFDNKIHFIASGKNIESIDCGLLIRKITAFAGGRGGGKKDMARGAGNDVSKYNESLNMAEVLIKEQLNK